MAITGLLLRESWHLEITTFLVGVQYTAQKGLLEGSRDVAFMEGCSRFYTVEEG